MFDRRNKSQYIGGQKEKFVRLDDLDSTLSMSSDQGGMNKCFNIEGIPFTGHRRKKASKSFNIPRGPKELAKLGQTLRSGVSKAVFPEDLRVSEKRIFDPQDRSLLLWNRLFVISCILGVSMDPLFFYLPVFNDNKNCLGMDIHLAVTVTTLRTVVDSFYLIRMALQFRTAYIAPSSRVFGRGELVIDPALIASRYLRHFFIVDLLSVLPLPQFVVWKFLLKEGAEVLNSKEALQHIILLQYIPRFVRFLPLISELKKTAGVFAESAFAGAAYYLLWYLLMSHILGALWYLLGIERNIACWKSVCYNNRGKCKPDYLYCGYPKSAAFQKWNSISEKLLRKTCNATEENKRTFNYGIYSQAVSVNLYTSYDFIAKFFYCLWWGLQNLSTLGQGLKTSTHETEVLFSISIGIGGLILFALLIGNMQTYLQSLTVRLEEMRIKRRDSEQWMHHRWLPQDLRERVRRYDHFKWLETRGVDEESLVQSLPKDLRRDIKRHLCLSLVRRVPLFTNMDERLLDAICERLKPSLCTEGTCVVREGDPVDEMLLIIRGELESVTTDGGRTGFYNRGLLKEGDFCGEELLTWALDPKSYSHLPSSTRTVRALTEVEAFALKAEDLKFVASQFRRLHSRQVQHTFRFYSQQWRTWAASFIQATWRRRKGRKTAAESQDRHAAEMAPDYLEEDEHEESVEQPDENGEFPSRLRATVFASRFAHNARRHREGTSNNNKRSMKLMMQKPSEPDFNAE
ncbi:putative cyclic nucleotide-gated ion channel 7 isoform X2 [Mangifera indica]|uniref:putative cyclic nucleotide-gated ion channel 7 isoform X2 n=1 Tax=Mangifera indica TaxID=29780 RepID=UPI001CF9F6BE|nr:putative cyclic nucleotide-gated ion channel 7 isoform X2 [Mangifera indica]